MTREIPPFRVVIPARYASTRLPGKPLLPIAGKPMLAHVCERALAAGAASVTVATDDGRIVDACRDWGVDVAMTDAGHASGTDRIAEVARQRDWSPATLVVNVQGDEPLLPATNVRQAAVLLASTPGAAIATLATPVESLAEFLDPNVVKVVTRDDGRALYFSRAPIPWSRDTAPAGLGSQVAWSGARRHVGLYAYRVDALARITREPATPLELLERLEQLRALALGLEIVVADAIERPGPGVDTAADLAHVESLIASRTG